MQTVYLGPGSTLEDGPAIAVAALGVEFGEGLCPRNGERTDVRFVPKSAYTAFRYRFRNLISFEGERETDSEEYGMVVGRDLVESTVRRAAKGAAFHAPTLLPASPRARSPMASSSTSALR
jgi:hypothetical protein